jgi:hypothetical protein
MPSLYRRIVRRRRGRALPRNRPVRRLAAGRVRASPLNPGCGRHEYTHIKHHPVAAAARLEPYGFLARESDAVKGKELERAFHGRASVNEVIATAVRRAQPFFGR